MRGTVTGIVATEIANAITLSSWFFTPHDCLIPSMMKVGPIIRLRIGPSINQTTKAALTIQITYLNPIGMSLGGSNADISPFMMSPGYIYYFRNEHVCAMKGFRCPTENDLRQKTQKVTLHFSQVKWLLLGI